MVRGYILCKLDVSLFRVKKDKVFVKSRSRSFCNFQFSLAPSPPPSPFFGFNSFSFLFRHFCKLAGNDCYLCYICLSQNMEKLIPTQQVFMSLSAGAYTEECSKNFRLCWTPIDIAGVLHELFFVLEKLHKKVLEKIKTWRPC